MTPRPLLPLAIAASLALGCQDATSVVSEAPRLLAVNGSTYPILALGDTAVLEGSGFGSVQGNGSVQFGATPATVLSWSDNQILVAVPDGAGSGPIAVAPDTGATVGPVPMLIRSGGKFSASSFSWSEGPALPAGLRAIQVSALTYPSDTGLTARVHATGGTTAAGIQLTSLFSVAGSGGLGTWVPGVDPAPAALLYAGATTATQAKARLRRHPNRDSTVEGVSYLIGGMDGAGSVVSDVYGMSVWENGDEGAWTKLVALPDPRAGVAATVAYGNIFVVGGFGPDSIALNTTSVAVVDSFGAPSGWISGPPLPDGRAFAAAVVHDHVLYVLGGESGAVIPAAPDSAGVRGDVFAIQLSPLTGFFEAAGWQTLTAPLLSPRTRHTAFDVDAGILVSVGIMPAGGAESEFAAFTPGPGGVLGPFAAMSAPSIGSLGDGSISEAGGASYIDQAGIPHVVIVGGITASGGLSRRVWWH